jgi:HlyD family secretion protein
MKRPITIVIILVAIGAGGAVFYATRADKEPTVTTLKTSRGAIVDAVGATGTLQAVTTVTVGTQVSGIVQELSADFNSIVKKGQVIARLDPSILDTQVVTAKANLANAQANLERQKVAVTDANSKLVRANELSAKQLLPKADLETADMTAKQADAQLKSTQSQVVQAEAAVNKAKVDLDHTIITAPIDGIVIKRSVDKGQTVNAGMSAPELFIIAADLTKMQVNANIDESDVGRMRPGQAVTFRVDAYPTETFHGNVKQVRLNPLTVQNVVTYSTVIDVPNQDLKLKPGMTANVNIEIARRDNVLRVPNAALRFRPTKDIFAALNQPMPADSPGGRGNRGGQNAQGQDGAAPAAGQPAANPAGAPGPAPGRGATGSGQAPSTGSGQAAPKAAGTATTGQVVAKAQPSQRQGAGGQAQGGGGQGQGGGRGFGNMTPEERQKRMDERMASMSPEEKVAFQERMKLRAAQGGGPGGGQPGGLSGRGGGGTPGSSGNAQRSGASGQGASRGAQVADNSKSASVTTATTIDSLFAPLQTVETRGRAWLYINKQLKSVSLRLGISDGTFTEVLNDSELLPETDVVTSIITPVMASKPATAVAPNAGNPLLPQRGGGRGGGR